MVQMIHYFTAVVMGAPLLAAVIAGMAGRRIGPRGAHWVTIIGMLLAFLASIGLAYEVLPLPKQISWVAYQWVVSGSFNFHVGFLMDSLTVLMLVTVTFVSLLVHVYSVSYMDKDPGYQRFFSYMSLFTFFMLMLASSDNFLQLFFGWEGVGLVSYLLIGFWFNKQSAAAGSLKAFIVNRVGDFGLVIGVALILLQAGSLNYDQVFASLPTMSTQTITLIPGHPWSVITVSCLFLFIGAMAKSAQIPLHIWLPESMEGPTPISALIHAATMVTAGVFMVARLSPLYEYSQVALSTVLIVGASGALFLGLLALVENDIKRVIAYSTMSQLGYMMAANGASAYHAAIFHLVTHAAFKALLFLAAGSVIMALHHEQDLRKMGGLRRYLPWTCACFLIGSLALAAIPPFAGFYSKDAIIEAVAHAPVIGAHYAYDCLLLGAFVTAWYTFRAFFMAFCGKERFSDKMRAHCHETNWLIRGPLLLLAVASIGLGAWLVMPLLYQQPGIWGTSLSIHPAHDVIGAIRSAVVSPWQLARDAPAHLPLWFSLAGIGYAYLQYLLWPAMSASLQKYIRPVAMVLREQYGFDRFNQWFFVRGVRRLSQFFYREADLKWLDGALVDGTGAGIKRLSRWMRYLQSGYLVQYVLVMMIGVLVFLIWLIFGR